MTPFVRIATLLVAILLVTPSLAHPIPNENHDRTILVRLTPTALVVDYRLEVDEARAARDLPRAELADITSRGDFHRNFCRFFADVLAGNLVVTLDGQPLELRPVSRSYSHTDHLRCDYRFEAAWGPSKPGRHTLTLRECNYELDDFSRLWLLPSAADGVRLLEVTSPGEELLKRPAAERGPGDGERLRRLTATFELGPSEARGASKPALGPDPEAERRPPRGDYPVAAARPAQSPPAVVSKSAPTDELAAATDADSHNLLHLLLDTRRGFVVLLLLAAGFGAAHALTPGHGKTLVAAYLIGERGTVWHAFALGLVVTFTHTAAVLLVAALLPIFFADVPPAQLQTVFGLVGGLLIAGLGFWLLMARLTGRADHVHLGGGHHHHDHHHHHGDDPHHHHHPVPQAAGWWGLVVLGISGGIIPCWDAIAMLGIAISAQRLWLGLPLLLAFSAGLAGVLIAIGIGVVHARNYAGQRLDRWQPFFRGLPIVSALVVTALGLWLCYDSVHR